MSGAFLGELESLFGWVVEASWQASILAALVLLLQWALRGRLNPRWHHALWLLVVARLVLPILPESALSLFQFAPAPPPAIARTVREPIFAAPPELPALPTRYLSTPPAHYPYSPFTVLALIWLTGALVLLILTWQVNRRFIRHVSNAPRITDPRLCHLAETARNELGVRRSPRIIESTQVRSPAIMGLFRPTLILPTEVSARFSDDELRFIFLHEFAHVRRGDLFLQWLVALLQIVHWFNPVLWYAFRQMRIDREPATDALVLSRTGEAQKESYGHVLVKLLEHHHTHHALPTLVGILEDKDQFKRRFLLIARFTRGAYGWSLLGILLVVILGVVCLTKSKAPATPKTLNSAVANSQLLEAVQKGDAAALQKLISQGADPNKVEDYGRPLIFAAGSPAVAEILLQHGADPNARDSQTIPVLSLLLANKSAQANAIARVLLEHGADPNIRDRRAGGTPLMEAQTGDAVDLLVQHGADIHLKTTDGRGALDTAPAKPLDYFQALLRHGVLFDVKKDGPTLLLHASWSGNLSFMKEMINRGVDPHAEGVWVTGRGKPQLMLPIQGPSINNHLEVAKFMVTHGAKAGGGMIAALRNRNEEIVKLLWENGARNISELCYQISQGAPVSQLQKRLNAGVPADPPQDTKITPLGEAAQLGNLEAVKLLIAHGADLNGGGKFDPEDPNYGQLTPLSLAAGEGQDEIAGYLLQRGAKPDPAAVYWAAFNSDPAPEQRSKDHFEKTVRILIDAGALKNITPDMAGLVLAGPIQTRLGSSNPTVLKMLLDAGVSPESPMPGLAEIGEKANSVIGYYRAYCRNPNYAQSAATLEPLLEMLEAADKVATASATDLNAQLLTAVQKGDIAEVQKLIGQGVDPNKVTNQGQPLLFVAGSPAVAEILLQHGANPNARDDENDVVLSSMLRNAGGQGTAIVRVLLEHGADPNIRAGSSGETPLMAARTGDAVDLLIQHGADIHLKMTDGSGVLEMAYQGAPSYFQALLRHGVAFDVSKDGPTLLLHASRIGNIPMMKEMLDRGVDPNAEGVWGMENGKPLLMHPIRAAALGSQPEPAKLLLAHGAKADGDMTTALSNRNNKVVKLLWESGVRNISALCYQISQGAPVSDLRKLLEAGVPADPPQDTKISPLGEAAQQGDLEAVKLLIEHKANIKGNAEIPPLQLAAAEGQDEVVAYLLQHGAKPTPATVAEAANHSYPYPGQLSKDHFEKTVRILIDAGALKNMAPDMAGAVLAAPIETRQGPPNATVLKMLLDAGISPESPVSYLTESGKKSNSVIGYCRELYKQRKDDPKYAQWASMLKPVLDMLETADAQTHKAVQTGGAAAGSPDEAGKASGTSSI